MHHQTEDEMEAILCEDHMGFRDFTPIVAGESTGKEHGERNGN